MSNTESTTAKARRFTLWENFHKGSFYAGFDSEPACPYRDSLHKAEVSSLEDLRSHTEALGYILEDQFPEDWETRSNFPVLFEDSPQERELASFAWVEDHDDAA